MSSRTLPPEATEASSFRYELARELAKRCPRELGRAIAVTGSVARGVADESSDIELNFWTDEIPPGAGRAAWLREMGAEEMVVDAVPGADGTSWVICYIRGVQIEAGWQRIEAQQQLVRQLADGKITDHQRLMVADTLLNAVPLHSQGLLAAWQSQLAEYPDGLGERLIAQAVERWSWPPFHWTLARRGEWLAVTSRLVADVHATLRILFALNRTWEPDWKWLPHHTQRLGVAPEHLVERIDAIFSSPIAERAVELCFQLVLDTLRLVPPGPDIARATSVVEVCLLRQAP